MKRRIETDEFPEMYKQMNECKERGEAGMCQLIDDYSDNRVKKEKIKSVLKMRGDLPIDVISKYTDVTKELIIKILSFNSDDTTYIYEQMKDNDFKIA